jgi:DedD protein
MKWLFWRKDMDDSSAAGPDRSRRVSRAAADDADSDHTDPAVALKIRARRRLIGAAALLLAAVIIVPMVLDPAPRPVPDTVPIEIPSEKTPFTPRLPLPPVPDPGTVQGGSPTESVAEPARKAASEEPRKAADEKPTETARDTAKPASADKPVEKPQEKSIEKPADKAAKEAAKAAEAQRARDILEGKVQATAAPKSAGEGKYFVQAAAPRSEQAAGELATKLKKAGLPSFTERVQASDGTRWRVRVGPYTSRQDAERARTKLRELGTGADLIAP